MLSFFLNINPYTKQNIENLKEFFGDKVVITEYTHFVSVDCEVGHGLINLGSHTSNTFRIWWEEKNGTRELRINSDDIQTIYCIGA